MNSIFMRRLFLTLALMVAVLGSAFAQEELKGNLTKKADKYLGKGEIANAKTYIDAAIEAEKYKDDGETWLIRGKVYQAIAVSEDEAIQALFDGDAVAEAMEAYNKVKEMEKEGSAIIKELTETQGVDPATFQIRPSILEDFRNTYFNIAVEQYNEENYPEGMKSFETCYKIMDTDTLAGLYAMTCAAIDQNLDGIERNAKALMGMDYHDPKMYLTWARGVYTVAAKESTGGEELSDKAKNYWKQILEIAQIGRDKNPEDGDLIKFMIDAYIRLGQNEEAVKSLQEAIKSNPEDKISYFSLGTLYDQLKQPKKSEEAFKKALEIDPDYFDALLNLSAMYSGQLNVLVQEYNDLIGARGQISDEAKANKLNGEMDVLRKKALPILEKCYELQPDNDQVIRSLAGMYNAIGDKENAEKFMKMMD